MLENVIYNLGEVEGSELQVVDHGIKFLYRRVEKPTNKGMTDKWLIFVQDEHSDDWRVIPTGLLSNDYSVANTENTIKAIQKALGGDVLSRRFYRSAADISVSFVLDGFQLNIDTDTVTNKILFGLMTGINVDEMKQLSALTFNITNSMAGNRVMTLNYGFLANIIPSNNKAIKTLSVNNLYLLADYSSQLIHDKKLSITYQEASNVQANVQAKIDEFKSTPVPDGFLKSIQKTFYRKPFKQMESLWEQLDEPMRNFYYLTFIVSYVVGQERRVDSEIKSRVAILDAVKRIRKAMDKDKLVEVVNQ